MQAVSASESMTSSPTPARLAAIDRRGGLSRAEFIREYRDPHVPVILTDASKDWPALAKFTFAFFKTKLGERDVTIRGKKYKLGEFIDILLTSTRDKPAPYPCKLNARAEFADLAADAPRYDLANPDRVYSRLLPKRFLDG